MPDNSKNIAVIVKEVEQHVQALGPLLASLNAPEILTGIAIVAFEVETVVNDNLAPLIVKLRNSVDEI